VATGERVQVTKEPLMGPCFAAVSPDGKVVAIAGGRLREVQLWDARKGTRIGGPMDARASWVAFSPDGAALAMDGGFRNLASGETVTFMPGELFATFSPDQQFVALSGAGVSMWRIATGQKLWQRGLRMRQPAVFSVDGKT